MKIWEQGLVATYSLPGYKELILEHYGAFKRPNTEITIHGVRDDASPTAVSIAGKAVNYAYLHRFHENQIVELARRAERDGFDVMIIGALQDPGLQIARTVVDIPVIGYGEVSMLTAASLGSRFSFVCINPDMDAIISGMIRDSGLGSKAAPNTFMDCAYADLSDAVGGRPERFLDAFVTASRRAMREQGVDVLLPGQTIIAELLWKAGLREIDGAVVLDPRLPLLRIAEMRHDMRQAGFGIARRGFYWSRPPRDLEAGVRAFYGIDEGR